MTYLGRHQMSKLFTCRYWARVDPRTLFLINLTEVFHPCASRNTILNTHHNYVTLHSITSRKCSPVQLFMYIKHLHEEKTAVEVRASVVSPSSLRRYAQALYKQVLLALAFLMTLCEYFTEMIIVSRSN